MVKLKLDTEYSFSPTANLDLIESAQEACNAYTDALALGADVHEMTEVITNIQFIKSTIEAHGVEWYVKNCDPKNAFAQMCAVQGKLKENWISAADAAIENLVTNAWEKIKEFFQKIWNWFTSFFDEKREKVSEQVVEEAKKEAEECKKEEASSGEKINTEEVVVAPKKTGWIKRALGFIGSMGKKDALEEGEQFIGIIHLSQMPKYIQTIQSMIDAWAEQLPKEKTWMEKFKTVKNKNGYEKVLADESTDLKAFAEKMSKLKTSFDELGTKMAKPSRNGEFSLKDLGINSLDDVNKLLGFADQLKQVCHGPKFKAVKKQAKEMAKACKDFTFSGDSESASLVSNHLVKTGQQFSKMASVFMDIQMQYDNYLAPMVKSITSKYKAAIASKKGK